MALDDIVESGKKDLSAQEIAGRFREDSFGYNPITAHILSEGFNPTKNPNDKATFESANLASLDERKEYIGKLAKETKGKVVKAVQADVSGAIRQIGNDAPEYLVGRDPISYSGSNEEVVRLHRSAVSAQKTIQAIKSEDEKAIGRAVKEYSERIKRESLAAKRSVTSTDYVVFALERNPGLAVQAAAVAASNSMKQFADYIAENRDSVLGYVRGIYDSLDDKKKPEEAYRIGMFLTQTQIAKEAEKAKKKAA